MNAIVGALFVLVFGGLFCLLAARRHALVRIVGPLTAVGGCLLGSIPAILSLLDGSRLTLAAPWQMPLGSFTIEMNPLSALFALPTLLVCALAAVYGAEYLMARETRQPVGASWFFFNCLTASMLLVLVTRNVMLFLAAWEIMSLSSFFLVVFDHEEKSVRHAGYTYLVAAHIGTAFLLVMFLILGRTAGSYHFAGFSGAMGGAVSGVVFVLALIGFGTKAGFMPMHVWLPEAHPAAPSHVSAVMSAVMIKTGIYGITRMVTYLGAAPAWWGWLLIGIGAVSGVLGVLFALAQHDFKRLLAYHSVENIGIIAMGLGVGLLGMRYGHPAMAFFGFAGALLHVLNHALFKGLLFLSAGAVLHAAGTREMDHLGGLFKRMPFTGLMFLIGSVAICGLPPLNGFVSEFLVYVGALEGIAGIPRPPFEAGVCCLAVVGTLALIGGLAAACFTKAFGTIFLGEPRSPHTGHAHEPGWAMRLPMLALATGCVAVGLGGVFVLRLVAPAVDVIVTSSGLSIAHPFRMETTATGLLWAITAYSAALLCLATIFWALREALMARRPVASTVTWDCGYAAPTTRMQYTSSSFAQPITHLFRFFLRTHHRIREPEGLFPREASFMSETPDVYRDRIYRPVFSAVGSLLSKFRWMQHGRVNLYILGMVVALLTLLIWKLR